MTRGKAREEIERVRTELRSRFGGDYAKLEAILFECDPIGINFGTNSDEYDPEVRTILPRLAACSTADDVQSVLHEELCAWFDPDTAGPRARYAAVAERVFRELRHLMKGAHSSHFNDSIEVALPGEADAPAFVFHYAPGAVTPTLGDAELDATISQLLARLGDAPGVITLSVETVLTKEEVAAGGGRPTDWTPTFTLMHRRFELLRERFANHGLAASRLETRVL